MVVEDTSNDGKIMTRAELPGKVSQAHIRFWLMWGFVTPDPPFVLFPHNTTISNVVPPNINLS